MLNKGVLEAKTGQRRSKAYERTKHQLYLSEAHTAFPDQHSSSERTYTTDSVNFKTNTSAPSTKSLLLSTDQAVITSTPQITSGLSRDDLFRCIAGMTSLNVTVEDEITISYIRRKNPTFSHSGNKLAAFNVTAVPFESERGFSQSENKVDFGRKLLLDLDLPDSSRGLLCSILITAAPGKVLSILFLNQTCSRENHVRVLDQHDGWSTTLDGCSAWKAPGYDVTTAARSAVMEIALNSLVDYFRLKVHVKAMAVRAKGGFITRYVSPVLGYVQTPSWHPFARPFAGITQGVVTVKVPSNHASLVSAVYLYLYCYHSGSFVELDRMTKGAVWAESDWLHYCNAVGLPDHALQTNVIEFRVLFQKVYGHFVFGVRVLFSIHRRLLTPHRHPGGLWNCSVPFWYDFHQHFVCNDKTECAGQEDEMGCPDTSCQLGGRLLNGECYFFLRLPQQKSTWHHSKNACTKLGASLASFPTINSWFHFALLSQTNNSDDVIHIGLQSTDASYPHMYRYSLQWHGGSISHFAVVEIMDLRPCCIIHTVNCMYTLKCAAAQSDRAAYALCQTMPSSGVNGHQNMIGNGNTRYRSSTQIRSSYGNTSRESFPFPSILCPKQHWTQDFLACDVFSACWHGYDAGPDDVSIDPDKTVTPVCGDVEVPSFKTLFPCQNSKSFVPYTLVCNRLQDCADNKDENFCVFPPCSAQSQYMCDNGQCLPLRYHCDEIVQCVDESDEAECSTNDFKTFNMVLLPRPPVVGNFDGRGWMRYKALTVAREEHGVLCPDTHIFCPGDGHCLPVYVRCNGLYDCPGHEDEGGCDSYTCPGLYRCRGLLGICLHPDHLCDGWPQCPQHDDELFCSLACPVNCTCLGHAFACASDFDVELFPDLRYLDANGIGLKPVRLVKNTMLVYLSLANCDLTHLGNLTLPNLRSLDLSDNRFRVVTVAELNLMKNLQNLFLARNPVSELFSGNYSPDFFVHEAILHVDLTGVELKVLDVSSHLPFPNLLSLNLSESGVTHLIGEGFRSLKSLRILDLRGCPMTEFPRHGFKELKNLRLVSADNYKLCCEASLPVGFNVDNCQAPFDEISSCDALLRADVYRVCLSVLTALALSGNLGSFSLRIFSVIGRGKTGFNVFVTHLCVSDFVMGVYMAVIGVADRLYLGRYLWEEGGWRSSATCQLAGVLALLSSEVSALIICLITMDRFLVIRFPFSRLRFNSSTAQIACFVTWAVGVVLVTVPLLPVTEYRHFYGQTGICVPLPITRNDFTGHRYAFGVMILFNLAIFLMIAAGQISVYLSMIGNAMSSIDTTRKSRDLIVARRLITVVVSDFLCWFPLGLLGVLAAQGVPVPGEVNVAMAVFVLPLNSALNPFLYTVNMIQERRQRAAEVKLLKMLTDRGLSDTQHVNK